MADVVTDGKTRLSWLPTCADISAPTVAECDAGVALEMLLTPDGYGIDFGNDEVDVTALGSTFSASLPGRQTLSTELTLKDQGRQEVPWVTFAGRPDGYLVVRRNADRTAAWAAGDLVEVYPVQAGQRRPEAPAANEVSKFMVSMFHTSKPDLNSTVAA